MRWLGFSLLVACGGSTTSTDLEPRTFTFGPYDIAPGEEVNGQCVSAKLDNDEPMFVSSVELTTGPGVHHSNWFWVPDYRFDGEDGTWNCADRGYDEVIAGVDGGVVFAQSTQAQHEIQAFAPGTAILIPPHSRIIAGTHLLNPSDATQNVSIDLTLVPIAEPDTILAGLSFTNESIALPPMRKSRFTVECDIDRTHQDVLSRPVDFNFHYALPHYHELGTGISITAIRADGTESVIFENTATIGDALGETLAPAFSMAGFQKIRFSCNYDNPRDQTVRWGVGDQEMCVFLAFTDSNRVWAGGALDGGSGPGTEVDHGDFVEFTQQCSLITSPLNTGE